MFEQVDTDIPWVLAEINNTVYAISCSSILSLSQMPTITPFPKSPREVRGVTIFRGKSIQFLDARTLLNFKTMAQEIKEFSDILDLRYDDHVNWINTLENCVMNGNEFTLTVDPHQCAFGKWYDSYNPKNTNIMFLSTFAKFDVPHKAIHEIGTTTQELIKAGKNDEAIKLIESVRNTEFKQMLNLFEELKIAYENSRKEIMVVLGDENHCVALSVDQILAIESLFEIDENLIKESITDTKYLSGVAKRKNGSVVFLLNESYLLQEYN